MCSSSGVPVHIRNSGEIYRAGERLPQRDKWMQHLAYMMDGAIQIGPWSVGLDPLIGLVPGFGDLIGAMISMLIVARAVQAGIPRVAIARMVTNIAMDTLVGSIPIFGDAFDFAYKSNLKNVRIYEEALYEGRGATARHWGFFLCLFLVVAAIGAAMVYGIIALVHLLVR
jgi:hypothetical protein